MSSFRPQFISALSLGLLLVAFWIGAIWFKASRDHAALAWGTGETVRATQANIDRLEAESKIYRAEIAASAAKVKADYERELKRIDLELARSKANLAEDLRRQLAQIEVEREAALKKLEHSSRP